MNAEDKRSHDSLHQIRKFKLPPAGFDVLRASERELVVYGLPPRPNPETHPVMAARWQRIAARAHSFITPELRPLEIRRAVDRGLLERREEREREVASYLAKAIESGRGSRLMDLPISGLSVVGEFRPPWIDYISSHGDIFKLLPERSGNWSGAWVKRPTSEPIKSVSAEWTVPGVNPPWQSNGTLQDGTYLVGTWVGIDGTHGTSDVLQAGTASECVVAGGKFVSTRFFAWTEWYSAPYYEVTNLSVSPGDRIACTVCAPFENTHGSALFNNLTTGVVTSVGIDPPAGVALSGNAAEWIVEDPSLASGAPYPFPVYNATVFTGCTAGTKNFELYAGGGREIDMVQGGVTLSSGIIEGKTTVYCHYGP